MGNPGVSSGTVTSWLGLNVEPAGRFQPCPVPGAGEKQCQKMAHWALG